MIAINNGSGMIACPRCCKAYRPDYCIRYIGGPYAARCPHCGFSVREPGHGLVQTPTAAVSQRGRLTRVPFVVNAHRHAVR